MTVSIPLNNGLVATIDDDDFERLSMFTWRAVKPLNNKTWYAIRYRENDSAILMHRQILGLEEKLSTEVDHRDGNGLNNSKENLRECTKSQNCANKGLRSDNISGFKGVSWADGKWRSRITVQHRIIHIGRYTDKIEAAKAYNDAAIKYFGEFANLNRIPE